MRPRAMAVPSLQDRQDLDHERRPEPLARLGCADSRLRDCPCTWADGQRRPFSQVTSDPLATLAVVPRSGLCAEASDDRRVSAA